MRDYFRNNPAYAGVAVAALGYFVDVYDLILFSVVRSTSLRALGVDESNLLSDGVFLLNMQMIGMLLGGILWGIWGDKKGRLSVLFGSIFLYSIANILNGMVTSVEQYAVLRFIAGIGLAGELGAGITLVSETLSKETRGYGTTIVASVGVAGAVAAGLIGDMFDWRVSYYIGGAMGLVLLVLRVAVAESGLYKASRTKDISRGNLLLLFSSRERCLRYICCIMIGLPTWYAVGVLMTFSPELAKAMQITEPVTSASAILFCYVGVVLGDIMSGLLSQVLGSRKKAIAVFLVLTAISCAFFLMQRQVPASRLYAIAIFVGFSVGFWAVFITTASEQFGTNLRATVTTTAPNFVRGSVVPVTSLFHYLSKSQGIVEGAFIVGAGCILIAALSLWHLKESFGKDLDFVEV